MLAVSKTPGTSTGGILPMVVCLELVNYKLTRLHSMNLVTAQAG